MFVSREELPGTWDTELDSFQKLLILRCLRADCLIQGLQDFVSAQLGQRFIEPQVESLTFVLTLMLMLKPVNVVTLKIKENNTQIG